LEKILAKTPNPELLQSIPGLHVWHNMGFC
jgi:hypothetical protein